MSARNIWAGLAATAAISVLAGCVSQPLPTPIVEAPPPIPARPEPPAVVSSSFTTPPRAIDGSYITINRALSSAETVWHLRAALNVAALGCRGPAEAQTVARYNALLESQKKELAAAYKAVQTEHRARWGKAWENEHDRRMTRIYNFFAQPEPHDDFCATAEQMLQEVATIAPGSLESYARTALGRIEAPFTSFYAAWDNYRVQVASWDARFGPNADPAMRYTAAPPALPASPAAPTAPAAAPGAATAPVVPAAPKLAYAPIAEVYAWQKPVVLAANGARTARTVGR